DTENLSLRVDTDSEDELGTLAGSFNRMAEELEKGVNQLGKEITEREHAEEQAKLIAEEWDIAFNSVTDLISIHDMDYKIIRVNKSFADLMNLSQEECIGRKCYQVVHGTDNPISDCPHKIVLETKRAVTKEFFEPKLGLHLEVSIAPIFDETGNVIATVHIARNITARKEAEEVLKKSEEKYSVLVEQARDGIIITQGEYIVYSNKAFVDISGYSYDEVSDINFIDLIASDSKDIVYTRYRDRLEGKAVIGNYEIRLECKDGTIKDIDLSAEIIEYQGNPAIMAIMRDITERKKMEYDIKERIKELTCLYNITQIVAKTDTDIDKTLVNIINAIPEALQYPEITCVRLIFNDKEFKTNNFIMTEWGQSSDIVLLNTKVGVLEVYYLDEKPEIDEGPFLKEERILIGNITRIITQMIMRKQAEEDLVRLNIELDGKVQERTKELEVMTNTAETASKAKSEFLASMSHELRTPLNAVIGFSQVLQEQYFGELNEKQTEYTNDILESGQHLLSLINDILDLSKIEAGKMELELSKVNIKDLLESSLIMIKEKALVHGISLNTEISKDLENLKIAVDERKIKQVMFNLLSNASKFTPDGGAINIEGRKEKEEIIISVSDTGRGLAPEMTEKIFEEFYQVSSGAKDKTPGTGLGLPLTRSIVEMHSGRIWAESKGLDKGSTFTFILPVQEHTGSTEATK
ncbi:PAS domain S-box protein, partial [Chloroflexota bacterium]